MKKITTLLVFLLMSGSVSISIGQTYTLSGNVVYYYNYYPVDSCRAYLKDSTSTKIEWTNVSSSTAAYSFSNLAPGKYYVGIDSCWSKYWGGSNSTDALMIMQHFLGIITLSGLSLLAADVDGPNYVNTLDAVWVQQRFVWMVDYFPAGDWVLNVDTLVDLSGDQTQNILTACFGDVNHTASPY